MGPSARYFVSKYLCLVLKTISQVKVTDTGHFIYFKISFYLFDSGRVNESRGSRRRRRRLTGPEQKAGGKARFHHPGIMTQKGRQKLNY